MSYLLATTESRVRWYVPKIQRIEDIHGLKEGEFQLLEELNLEIVPGFGNKETAKKVAIALGLKTWRYVRLDTPKRVYTLTV
jgi:hypothetical protein